MRLTLVPRSIRGKAVLGSGLAIAVFGLGIGVGSYVVVTQSALTSETASLETQVGAVSDQLSEQAVSDPALVDLESLQSTAPTFIQVVSPQGDVLAASPSLRATDRICPATIPTTSTTDRAALTLAGSQDQFLRSTTTVETPSGPVVVCAATSDLPIRRAQEAVLLALVVALPILVLGVCVVVWFAVGRALRAVDDMASQAETMQSTSDGVLRIRETGDEVERLGRTLNGLLTRLHHQSKATRQFVADAGHELRNPLTTLRVTLEFAQDGDEEAIRSSIRDALGDLDRIDGLVQDLLVLARTDAMDHPVEPEDLDLADLVNDAVATSRRGRPDVSFRCDAASCHVSGNGLALRSLLANLLDNAARHARTGVEVRVVASDGQASIHVDDDGQGLAPNDCERVFDRFVRLDEARDRDEGGSGLGLAIVASVAEWHGGRASATPGPGGHFTVVLPTITPG